MWVYFSRVGVEGLFVFITYLGFISYFRGCD